MNAVFTRAHDVFNRLGLTWLCPMVKLLAWEAPGEQLKQMSTQIGLPVLGCIAFVLIWTAVAPMIKTPIGAIPGPMAVVGAAEKLWQDASAQRTARTEFVAKDAERIAKLQKRFPGKEFKPGVYSGKATFLDKIYTSLITVFTGFMIASVIAIPVGILCGMSKNFFSAMSPLIQIFKPVSPLAWLPIVTLCVGAMMTSQNGYVAKSFVISAIVVALCSLWPTLINTALGVASLDKDFINVARVLNLSPWQRVSKIIIPSSLPLIFTGLRLSLGVGWMVLIAAEMLSQNEGLGKFIWDMFQNGSSETLSMIVLAVFVIGIVGFILDRVMVALQRLVSYDLATAN